MKRPVIYLRHGTTGMKRTYYTGDSYWNNMFRFLAYNPEEIEYLIEYNDFRPYQLHYGEYHPRYGEFIRKDKKYTDKNQILWFLTWREYFGTNIETKMFTKSISNVLKSAELKDHLIKNDLKLRLCVHQFFDESTFKDIYEYSQPGLIEIVHSKNVNVMDELVKSKLLITDYSSVAYDFTFLNRPVLLYQPDLEVYNKTREFFCKIEDLNNYNIKSSAELISKIINHEYGINPFFRKTLPEKIDYDYIQKNKHIHKLYQYFAKIQRNRITIIGLSFYEHNDVVNSTMNLAESLLESGYLLEVISLYHPKRKRFTAPYGLNMIELYWPNTPSKKDKLLRKIHSSKRNYHYLKYDSKLNLLHPYSGYYLDKLMKNSRSKTIISTRESTHIFLDNCTSDKVKNKIYFFHSPTESPSSGYSQLIDKIKDIDYVNTIFVSENDISFFEDKVNLKNSSKMIMNDYLVKNQLLKPNLKSEFLDENYNLNKIDETEFESLTSELKQEYKLLDMIIPKKKETYNGLCLLNLDSYYKKDIEEVIKFGNYLKDNSIDNIKLDIMGNGDYSPEFIKSIVENDLFGFINYLGNNRNILNEIRNHDFIIDFSLNPSYNTHYLQGVLNYKKVFCMENPKSREIFNDVPNSFIESYEWLCNQINNLDEITLLKLHDNFNSVNEKFSNESTAKEFLNYIE